MDPSPYPRKLAQLLSAAGFILEEEEVSYEEYITASARPRGELI